jgi:hypothetical protein
VIVVVACLLYRRDALRDGDYPLAMAGSVAAAGFVLAGLGYLWLAL